MPDKILIQQFDFYASVGVTASEREVGQRLRANLELWLDLRPAGQSDDLSDTVSYAEVVEMVEQVARQEPVALLERMAERIAAALLEQFPVERVRLQLLKVPPPIPPAVEAAGVEIERQNVRT